MHYAKFSGNVSKSRRKKKKRHCCQMMELGILKKLKRKIWLIQKSSIRKGVIIWKHLWTWRTQIKWSHYIAITFNALTAFRYIGCTNTLLWYSGYMLLCSNWGSSFNLSIIYSNLGVLVIDAWIVDL